MKASICRLLIAALLATGGTVHAIQVRVRDVSFVLGARDNQLYGIGLVAGLANDGDKDPAYTLQAMQNALQSIGISVPATQITAKNVAVVLVTAVIPPNAKDGSKIDITVASMGDAKSLQGGVLLPTRLYGPNGDNVAYASAAGKIAVGGFSLGSSGAGGANVQKNHPTTGQIINGALVERAIPTTVVRGDSIFLVLREHDYSTAARMAEAINEQFPNSCHAEDSTTVRVKIPDLYRNNYVPFIGQLEAVPFEPDTPARIIINERTGTIVVSARTRVSTCAVAHGNIVVKIAETQEASQPSPFAQTGQTVVTTRTDTSVTEDSGRLRALPDLPTVEKLAYWLNQMGATPRDMMAIFEAMKQAGALQAELRIE
jgi:flagellar P-ring protein FlgI